MFIFKKAKPAAFKSRLDRYIDANGDELARLLCRAWDGQRNAMTYDRIGLSLLNGFDGVFREWQQEYAELVNTELARYWLDAANAGARLTEGRFEDFVFDDTAKEVREWIRDHGADFVVQITEQTRLAIGGVVALGQMQGLTNEQIAHNIRPLIGLTRCQSLANHNYYERQLRALTRDHPKTSAEKLEEIARARQARYAGRQHRYRADTIATTELAFAYNKGYHESVRQAMQRGFMGPCVKVWSTAQSERTCPTCAALNGERIGFDDKFSYADRTGLQETPPAHPRCRCTVKYEEVGEAVAPPLKLANLEDVLVNRSLKEVGRVMKTKLKPLAEQYAASGHESKWNGRVNQLSARRDKSVAAGKRWSCSVGIQPGAPDAVLLHELLHSCSASHFPKEVYFANRLAEEYPVQYLCQEICRANGIANVRSRYDNGVMALRRFRIATGDVRTDLQFATDLFRIDLPKRFGYLERLLEEYTRRHPELTIDAFAGIRSILDGVVQ